LGPQPRNVEILYARSDARSDDHSKEIKEKLGGLKLDDLQFLKSEEINESAMYERMAKYVGENASAWKNGRHDERPEPSDPRFWFNALNMVDAMKELKRVPENDRANSDRLNHIITESAMGVGQFPYRNLRAWAVGRNNRGL
ncbi:hypothetical protein H0H93_012366, partial [Arthromyces matolae]